MPRKPRIEIAGYHQ